MIVKPMVPRGLPRKDSINPLSKKQNLGILTFYKVRLFNLNAYFIFLAASIILTVLKVPKTRELTEKQWRRHRLRMVRNTIIIAIPSIVAVYYMVI